jgi:hypothetical protein
MPFKVLRFILAPVIILGLLAGGWTWLTLHWSYAEGERTGYVQKLSKKGWLCKTWEGEIVMVTMPGAIPEKFEFTVRDQRVVDAINTQAGQRVVLHYKQHKFIPTTCFGETEYFVDNVRGVTDMLGTLPQPSVPQGRLQEPR